MNKALKHALDRDERPAYRVALAAGISRTMLHHILYGIRAARPQERAALARELRTSENALFPTNARAS